VVSTSAHQHHRSGLTGMSVQRVNNDRIHPNLRHSSPWFLSGPSSTISSILNTMTYTTFLVVDGIVGGGGETPHHDTLAHMISGHGSDPPWLHCDQSPLVVAGKGIEWKASEIDSRRLACLSLQGGQGVLQLFLWPDIARPGPLSRR
jgi:hypothetical protein